MNNFFSIDIAYATTTAADMVNAVHDNFAADINASYDFWYWIGGTILGILAIVIFWGAGKQFFKSIFGIKGRY